MIQLPSYSQTDPRWKDLPLGTSGYLEGPKGCALTSTAMHIAAYGINMDPGQLTKLLNANDGFDSEGFIKWSVLVQLFPQLYFGGAFYTTNHTGQMTGKIEPPVAIERIKKLVRLGQPVLLHVDHSPSIPGEDHFVDLFDAPDDLTKWMIHDPDMPPNSAPIPFQQRYGSPLTGIFGWRQLLGPPTMFPDYSTPFDESVAQALWKASQIAQGKNVMTYSKEIIQDITI